MLLDLLLPPVCVGCGVLVRSLASPICARCATSVVPLSPELRQEQGIEACWGYAGPWKQGLHRLKYQRQLSVSGPLGRALAGAEAWSHPWDRVVPVPLHWTRRLVRGFNQVELLVAQVARHHPWVRRACTPGLLRRTQPAPPQVRADAPARRANVERAFVAPCPKAVQGRDILVVDDVVTTAATLGGCMRALRAAGASRVAAVALLRAA